MAASVKVLYNEVVVLGEHHDDRNICSGKISGMRKIEMLIAHVVKRDSTSPRRFASISIPYEVFQCKAYGKLQQ